MDKVKGKGQLHKGFQVKGNAKRNAFSNCLLLDIELKLLKGPQKVNFVNPEQCSPNLFLKAFRYILHELRRQSLQYFPSFTIRNFSFIPHLNLSCSILGLLLCVPSIGKTQARLLHQLFNTFLDT